MKTTNIVSDLVKFGIRARPYLKPPNGKEVFTISIVDRKKDGHNEGTVLVHQGTAIIEIAGSKKFRQATISVTEKPRQVTRRVEQKLVQPFAPNEALARHNLRTNFPVLMPNTTDWGYKDLKIEKAKRPKGHIGGFPRTWVMSAEVTATVGKTTVNHFLVGMDETHHFISPIMKHAKSVAEAHRLLRPKRMAAHAIRQGEWFFHACDTALNKWVDKQVDEGKRPKEHVLGANADGDGGTTHTAASFITLARKVGKALKRISFVRGYILDTRRGHHKALFFHKWHRVVRNKEAKIKVSPAQREGAARRRRSWD